MTFSLRQSVVVAKYKKNQNDCDKKHREKCLIRTYLLDYWKVWCSHNHCLWVYRSQKSNVGNLNSCSNHMNLWRCSEDLRKDKILT